MSNEMKPQLTPDDVDILVSAIAGGEAGDAQWDAFSMIADETPSLWRDLALAIRDQSELAQAMVAAVALADAIEIPAPAIVAGTGTTESNIDNDRTSFSIAMGWSGWAIAALVAIMAIVRFSTSPVPPTPSDSQVQFASTPEEAFDHFMEVGREAGVVVREVPTRQIVDTRRAPDGDGYDLLYLRQVLQRVHVPDLYEVQGVDERGRATLANYAPPVTR